MAISLRSQKVLDDPIIKAKEVPKKRDGINNESEKIGDKMHGWAMRFKVRSNKLRSPRLKLMCLPFHSLND